MDKTLQPLHFNANSANRTPWDLQYFILNYKYLDYNEDQKNRSLVDNFFLKFDEQIHPIQHELRTGIIHNHGNDWNAITRNGHPMDAVVTTSEIADSFRHRIFNIFGRKPCFLGN